MILKISKRSKRYISPISKILHISVQRYKIRNASKLDLYYFQHKRIICRRCWETKYAKQIEYRIVETLSPMWHFALWNTKNASIVRSRVSEFRAIKLDRFDDWSTINIDYEGADDQIFVTLFLIYQRAPTYFTYSFLRSPLTFAGDNS